MSLTSFVIRPDVRQRLREEFPKPRIPTDLTLLAPPQSGRYALVGAAFDYLLRFKIQRLNPKAQQRRWVAEAGLNRLAEQATRRMLCDVETEGLSFPDDDGSLKNGRRILERARSAHKRYLASGSVTDTLLKSVIGLAQLDVIFRSGFVDENLGDAYREDVRDLRKLLSLVHPDTFRAKRSCILNPVFGVGSKLIGGADADLFIDGTLIDIKATTCSTLRRDDFNQLLGYLAMHEIWGINGLKRKPKVTRIGIYFARYGSLQTFAVRECVDSRRFHEFLEWFKRSVEQRAKSA